MNRDGSVPKPDHQRLWSRPLQAPSRSGNDAQETAILSSIHSIDQTRLKRNRTQDEEETSEQHQQPQYYHHQHPQVPAFPSVMEPLKPVFQIRPLSLDRGAIAPSLAHPTAPFAKSARKKAYVSAIYYSECFLRNIQPREADLAAFDIQNQYTKWWVHSKNQITNSSSKRKRRRLESTGLESEDDTTIESLPSPLTESNSWDPEVVALLKERMVEHLQKTGGDTTTTEFRRCLEHLQAAYASQQQSAPNAIGTWLTLSKPAFSEGLGRNEDGGYLYTLGRLSFDMFRPTNLKCSIRALMNNIRLMDPNSKPKSFPSRLSKELQEHHESNTNPIRHYDIVVAFTIQANQTRDGAKPSGAKDEFVVPRPIRGLITNHGYMVDDPTNPNRCSIWFSGGSIEVQDEVADAEVWKQIFDESLAPRRDTKAIANMLAAKLLLGAHTRTSRTAIVTEPARANADDNEVTLEDSVPIMSYYFKRPIGGHGEVFCDALFVDDTLRITRGHFGSIFVSTRVPTFQEPAT